MKNIEEILEKYPIKDCIVKDREKAIAFLLGDFNKKELIEILTYALAPSYEEAAVANYFANK